MPPVHEVLVEAALPERSGQTRAQALLKGQEVRLNVGEQIEALELRRECVSGFKESAESRKGQSRREERRELPAGGTMPPATAGQEALGLWCSLYWECSLPRAQYSWPDTPYARQWATLEPEPGPQGRRVNLAVDTVYGCRDLRGTR